MNAGALYPVLKALHVAAAMTFLGGVLAGSLVLSALQAGEVALERSTAVAAHLGRWSGRVTTPAMMLVWGLGLTLASQGHWFATFWLPAKLVAVVGLSALHGLQSAALRRLAGGEAARSPAWAPTAVVIAALWIAILVVMKPF